MQSACATIAVEPIVQWLRQQAGADARVYETHISVVVAGREFAWKLKKPVQFSFLDFSTRERRRQACRDELRLNRRFSPELYLDVRGICSEPKPHWCSAEDPSAEPVVCMRAFDDRELLARRLAEGRVQRADFAALGDLVAAMHTAPPPEPQPDTAGKIRFVARQMQDNIRTLAWRGLSSDERQRVASVARWWRRQVPRLWRMLTKRRRRGFVRACHGDLHLNNIVWVDGRPLAFDCIEFDPLLYWIDTMNDLAFLWMDLRAHGAAGGANVMLNRYLEQSGDYAGVALLRWFAVYRAMVRAKIAVLSGDDERLKRYLAEAVHDLQQESPRLWITHGVSGSGKSWWTARWLMQRNVIRIRTDVERRRLAAAGRLPHDRYSPAATRIVYHHCVSLARRLLDAGWEVVIDGTFLQRWQRNLARRCARRVGCPWSILSFSADEAELRRRIDRRLRDGGDTSEATIAVLRQQLRTMEPLSASERAHIADIDTTTPP